MICALVHKGSMTWNMTPDFIYVVLCAKKGFIFLCVSSWTGIAHMVAHWLGDWDLWSAPGSNPSKGESLQKYKEQCICIGNSASKSVFAN